MNFSHIHKWISENSNDHFRSVVMKIHHCECGAVKMLTAYGWRAYKDMRIIEENIPIK